MGLSMYILCVCVLYVYVNHIGQNVTTSLDPMSKERESVTDLNLVLNEQSVNELWSSPTHYTKGTNET